MLKIPLLNTEHDTIYIPRKSAIGKLQPIEIEDSEVSNVSWTKYDTDTTNSPVEILSMPPESSFQLEHNNTKQSVVLQDAQILQKAKEKVSALLEGDYNSIVLKSPMVVGRRNLFQMDIPATGPLITWKPYPISLKYQKIVDKEIRLLENAGCISKSLSLCATPVIIVPKKPDPLNPQKQQICLVLDYWPLYKSINVAHNGNSVIYYYPLPNVIDLLARLQSAPYFPH